MKKLVAPLMLALLFVGCQSHFISDDAYRDEVEAQFELRRAEYEPLRPELFYFLSDESLPMEHQEALKFLYAYMSLNDLADYDASFIQSNVKWAFQARDYFSWGDVVPQELFRHFVLPPRVNNENLDSARIVFFNELKERIAGMSMTQAALEVNHWCHEKVTYRGADARTSAPLATVRTAFGRCGEESTFTVAALRAVGIPARQCYTPRWAHSDDNHAWVEVWADGKWYFMGACEPEAELNRAWFTEPAKRAMMVHTNVFGKYYGTESRTEFPLYTKINVLENYTDTKRFEVKVIDSNGAAVSNAQVRFLLYNYAEYYPIYSQQTNDKGIAFVISGLGDLLVSAYKDGAYAYKKVSLTNEDGVTLQLDSMVYGDYTEELDLTPPANRAIFAKDTSALTQQNNQRLRYEDSIRNAYRATFMKAAQAKLLAEELNLDAAQVEGFISRSEGNHAAISSYIRRNASNSNALNLLSTLTDKDLRDTPTDILESHLNSATAIDDIDKSVFVEGVLSPRIGLELIRSWRPYLQEQFKGIFADTVSAMAVKDWVVQHIKLVDDENYSGCPISPIGVERLRKADRPSRSIFYVALCRSLGIPAKIDMATSEVKVFEHGKWQAVSLDPQSPAAPRGNLVISYTSMSDYTPQYLTSYSIAKYDNGLFTQLDFENDPRVASFPVKLNLEQGYYRLTTGNRYANGKVLAHNTYFTIDEGKTQTLDLVVRSLPVERKVYGRVSTLVSSDWYSKGMVICFMEPDREPTKHIMKDIPLLRNEFNRWGGRFVFVVPEGNLRPDFSLESYPNLPDNSLFVTMDGAQLMNSFLQSTNQAFRDNYPLVYVVNPSGDIIFMSEGYRIGMGDMLWKVIQ